MHITAKKKKVPEGVSVVSIQGVSWPIRYVPIHNDSPVIDIEAPLIFTGYISESSTNITAHIEIAQAKM